MRFGGRTENCHQLVLELDSGADFRVHSVPFFEPDPLRGVLGPSLAEQRPKSTKSKYKCERPSMSATQTIPSPRALIVLPRLSAGVRRPSWPKTAAPITTKPSARCCRRFPRGRQAECKCNSLDPLSLSAQADPNRLSKFPNNLSAAFGVYRSLCSTQ